MSTLHQISGCGNADRKADVVFVHGLGGDAFGTWRHGNDDSTSWPHWLGQDHPEIAVWSLGYAASPTKWRRIFGWFSKSRRDAGYSMALPDRALQVLDYMVQSDLGQRPLLFICHSLGGLLAKHVLRTADDATIDPRMRQVATNTRAVLFLATPHCGAELASLLNAFRSVFGTTLSIENLRAHDAHLLDLYNWYRRNAVRLGIETNTYYEKRGVGGALTIVNSTSAQCGVGPDAVPLDEDHLSIAKPRDRDAQVCCAARDLIRYRVLATPSSSGIVSIAIQTADLKRLLAELGNDKQSPIADPNLQLLLASLLDENRRLRDEIEVLRASDSERLELMSKVAAVQHLLSKRVMP